MDAGSGEFWVALRPAPGAPEDLLPAEPRDRPLRICSIKELNSVLPSGATLTPTKEALVVEDKAVAIWEVSPLGLQLLPEV